MSDYRVEEAPDHTWTAVVTKDDGGVVRLDGWANETAARVAAVSMLSRVGFGPRSLKPRMYTGRRR